MKILLIGGNIPDTQLQDIFTNTIGNFQFAANEFQNKLIKGFKEIIGNDFYVLSAPFVNSYPKGYKKIIYKGFEQSKNEKYVSFFNAWGIRNISRNINLNKNIKDFINIKDSNKYVIVYSPHVPFLKTAYKIKRKDSSIKIILLLPDLPQFVALEEKISLLYRILKKFDVKQFYKYSDKFDSYILLTKHMNDFVNKKNKKFIIIEGIADTHYLLSKKHELIENNDFTIVYTGTLHKKFGVCNLIDAFKLIKNKNFKLLICGYGDAEEYVKIASQNDRRINYLGQVSNNEALNLQRKANVLVNPRQNVGMFTKYSFPSKNMEYLSSGIPVIAYKLEGIPNEYDSILFYPKDDSIESLKDKILQISQFSRLDYEKYYLKVKKFLISKNINNTIKKILSFINNNNNS